MKEAQASKAPPAQSAGSLHGPEPTAQSPAPAFATLVQSLLHEVWGLVYDHLLLVALEAQHAGRNITRMVFAGVVAAVLIVTGWLALVASVMFWVVAADASWAPAFLAVGLLHAAISVALIAWIRRLAAEAMFSVTLRQLQPRHKAQGDEA
jgi:uncharacterized membrane protein YqjE